jgi:hypothetical protein
MMYLFSDWLSCGLANAIASSILNPMDISKTRMQVEEQLSTGKPSSLRRTLFSLYRAGGLRGLWSPGLFASIMREMLYSGPRSGFYVPFRDIIDSNLGAKDSSISLFCKILTAMSTGTLGAIIANPVDVIKIRLMVEPSKYNSLVQGLHIVYSVEGLSGLYKGIIPSTLRGAFIAAGELATYDHAKSTLKLYKVADEGVFLHSASSLITGVVATTVAAPFDIIKTRYV